MTLLLSLRRIQVDEKTQISTHSLETLLGQSDHTLLFLYVLIGSIQWTGSKKYIKEPSYLPHYKAEFQFISFQRCDADSHGDYTQVQKQQEGLSFFWSKVQKLVEKYKEFF